MQTIYPRQKRKKRRESLFERFKRRFKNLFFKRKKGKADLKPSKSTKESLVLLTPSRRQIAQKIFFGLSLFLLLQIIFEILLLPFLNIRFIQVEGLKRIQDTELLSVAGIQGKEYYFSLNERLVEKKIEEIAWVKKAQAIKMFPNRLQIKIEERVPIFLHMMSRVGERGSIPLLIDEDGVIFVIGKEALAYDVPFLSGVTMQSVELKSQFPLFLRRIFQDVGALKKQHRPLYDLISEVNVESKWGAENYDISLYLTNTPIVFTLSSRLDEEKMTQILLVLDVLNKDKQLGLVEEVDLRGQEAVYRYGRE